MLGRQFAIGFGIAILVPLLIFYGVSTFVHRPLYQEYVTTNPFTPNATPEERAAKQEQQKAEQNVFNDAQKEFAKRLFYVSVLLGYAAILVGGLKVFSSVGTGLIFGGIFAAINGHWTYWGFIEDWQRFVSLLFASAIIILIAYRRVPTRNVSDQHD